ncbi:MAG: O-antigen ligase family protein [Planctomycetota bacterium]|jgi:hypothetical protein
MAAAPGDDERSRAAATILRWSGLLGIMTILVARCLVVFAPQVLFDVDPAQASDASDMFLAAYGPVGSLGLDVALALACAAAIFGEALAGRRIDVVLIGLALVPGLAVWIHGQDDAHDLWRGSTWVAAALTCVTVAHLARDRRLRLLLAALLIAIVAPLLVRGTMQVTIEHDATLAQFEASKDRYFAERGWEPGSPSALIYERRLRQRQPTGWFPTTNIFASVMAFGLVAWLGLAIAAARSRLPSGWWGTPGLLALLASAGLLMCGSKGAVLAALAGVVVLLAPMLRSGFGERIRARAGLLLIGLMIAAIAGVVVRGVILPESFLGEKSLLFRWHYLVGSGRMLSEAPLLGVGPDGFQAAYVLHRLPRSPEEVSSAHSMMVDWIAMLGAGGALWIVLVGVMLWRATGEDDETPAPDHAAFVRAPGFVAFGVAAAAMLIALPAEWHTLGVESAAARLIGAATFALVATLAAQLMDRVPGGIVRWSFLAALAALLVHGQIEMTFYQPGAVVWAMVAIGLVGRARPAGPTWSGAAAGAVITMLALATLWFAYRPALLQQISVRQAAATLWPPADDLAAHLDQRRRAADRLLGDAWPAWPSNRLPLRATVEQALLGAAIAPDEQRIEWLAAAAATADELVAAEPGAASLSLRSGIQRQLATATGDQSLWDVAIADAQRITELDPHAVASWKRLGDTLWEAGRRSEAASAYERALGNSDHFELDPLKQLPSRDRAVIDERMRKAESE